MVFDHIHLHLVLTRVSDLQIKIRLLSNNAPLLNSISGRRLHGVILLSSDSGVNNSMPIVFRLLFTLIITLKLYALPQWWGSSLQDGRTRQKTREVALVYGLLLAFQSSAESSFTMQLKFVGTRDRFAITLVLIGLTMHL